MDTISTMLTGLLLMFAIVCCNGGCCYRLIQKRLIAYVSVNVTAINETLANDLPGMHTILQKNKKQTNKQNKTKTNKQTKKQPKEGLIYDSIQFTIKSCFFISFSFHVPFWIIKMASFVMGWKYIYIQITVWFTIAITKSARHIQHYYSV